MNSNYASHTTSKEIKRIMTLKDFLEDPFSVSKQSNHQVPPLVFLISYIVGRQEMYPDERVLHLTTKWVFWKYTKSLKW